ncbi:MAG: hypothetical protein ACLGHL_09960 [Actinomycetota bacterium]
MSILLIGVDDDLATVLSRRLIDQDDEVRVLVTEDGGPSAVPDAAVHVASGRYLDDADLIERASQNVRTIVLGSHPSIPKAAADIVSGARSAGVSRIVYCADAPDPGTAETVKASAIEYAILATGKRRRRGLSVDAVAEAIDAADDLADKVALDLDLTRPEQWSALRLSPPDGSA